MNIVIVRDSVLYLRSRSNSRMRSIDTMWTSLIFNQYDQSVNLQCALRRQSTIGEREGAGSTGDELIANNVIIMLLFW